MVGYELVASALLEDVLRIVLSGAGDGLLPITLPNVADESLKSHHPNLSSPPSRHPGKGPYFALLNSSFQSSLAAEVGYPSLNLAIRAGNRSTAAFKAFVAHASEYRVRNSLARPGTLAWRAAACFSTSGCFPNSSSSTGSNTALIS